MTPATRSLLARTAPIARWGTPLVLFVLLLGMLPTASTAPIGSAAPHLAGPAAHAQAAVTPAAGCSNNGTGNYVLNLTPSQGPVPLTTQFNLTTVSLPTPYQYEVAFGDGTWSNGTVSATCTWGQPITTLVSHTYTWPEVYRPWATVWGFNGGGGSIGYGVSLYAWGAAGPNPFNITTNVSYGSVPLAFQYSMVANASVPSGLSYTWGVSAENGSIAANTAGFTPNGGNLTIREPGFVSGQLTAQYANGSTFAVTALPMVWVAPLLNLQLGAAVTQGASPFHATFWANATNASGGGVPTIAYTDNWSFGDGGLAGGGSPVTHVYWDNNTVNWGVTVTVNADDGNGNVIGTAQRFLWLVNNSINSGPALGVNLTALYPSTAPAPFTLNVTATAWGGVAPYELQLCVTNGTAVPPSTPGNCTPAYTSGGFNWYGNWTEIPVNFSTPGLYTVTAYVDDRNASTPYADAWVYANITNGVTWAPLVMSTIVSPTSGVMAPVNVSVAVAAAGGVTPYYLTVWTWPGNVSSGLGPSNLTYYTNGFAWNGSGWSGLIPFPTGGTWTIGVAVQDSATNFQEQRTVVTIGSPPPAAAPLIVSGAFVPSAPTGPASFSFSASVAGGVAPYVLVWNFGDGSSEPGSPSGVVTHTYTHPGWYYPSLSVTDHVGQAKVVYFGPLLVGPPIVTVGAGPAAPAAWEVAIVAVALLGSALAVALVVRWATHRREGLNWVRPFEEPSDGRTRPPSAP